MSMAIHHLGPKKNRVDFLLSRPKSKLRFDFNLSNVLPLHLARINIWTQRKPGAMFAINCFVKDKLLLRKAASLCPLENALLLTNIQNVFLAKTCETDSCNLNNSHT